ncbi:GNAT family N-acetyltransferase [Paraburkholderia unamae]|uniref:GNAT family N-acetyltransferase n=1 Tax=Paraburkholderia unamae TaxID=219649 RepID=A0ACC6RG69_9BURK
MLTKRIVQVDEKHAIHVNHFHDAAGNHLFNEPAYFRLHSSSPRDAYVQLVRRSDAKVYATVAFFAIDDESYLSPKRGTFGGLSMNHQVEFETLERFLSTLLAHLNSEGARVVRVRCAPASHDLAAFSTMFNLLTRSRFALVSHELNYDLRVDDGAFVARIDYGNAKRLRKAQREGFVAERVGHERCDDVHRVIEQNRARLGVGVSMSAAQLRQMVELFPKKLHFFSVFRDAARSEIVAAAVCIALTESVFYVFYWGDVDGMSAYSPIVLLASTIYEFCQQNGFTVLDAGISTLHGDPNYGLVRFKRNLGFQESVKLDFELHAA